MATPSILSGVLEVAPAVLVGVGGIGYVGYQVIRSVIRRYIRDGLEITKDRTENDFVKQLMDHNNTLTAANTALRNDSERLIKERAETLAKLGKLESDLEHSNRDLAEAHTDIALLRRQLGMALTPPTNSGD